MVCVIFSRPPYKGVAKGEGIDYALGKLLDKLV